MSNLRSQRFPEKEILDSCKYKQARYLNNYDLYIIINIINNNIKHIAKIDQQL